MCYVTYMKPPMPTIVLIEDDLNLVTAICWKLKDLGIIRTAANYEDALNLLNQSEPSMAIIDLHLGQYLDAGKQLLHLCKTRSIPSIAITSDERAELVYELYELGASHFLYKKNFTDLLYHYVNITLKTSQINYFEELFKHKFITLDLNFQNQLKTLWKMPLKSQSLHITGPTGSGKSHLAELLHKELFPQSTFIHLNCAELSESLLESELFGHSKGSFTGADKDYPGKLLLANNGILFLDEIGSLTLSSQAKLLKVLETKTYYPVGSNEKIKVNFTLITATWENLLERTKNNDFRLDLLQRIIQYKIDIPALQHRPADIQHFINQWMEHYPRKFCLSPDAHQKILNYNFPGNFRELNALLLQISQTPKGKVEAADLDSLLCLSENSNGRAFTIDINEIIKNGIKNYLQKLERKIVLDSFERNHQQVTAVLQELKLSPSSFYRITQQD
jgi:DNA-binding NtrC family response regulator